MYWNSKSPNVIGNVANWKSFLGQATQTMVLARFSYYHRTELSSQNLIFWPQFWGRSQKLLCHFLSVISHYHLAKFGWVAFADLCEWRLAMFMKFRCGLVDRLEFPMLFPWMSTACFITKTFTVKLPKQNAAFTKGSCQSSYKLWHYRDPLLSNPSLPVIYK